VQNKQSGPCIREEIKTNLPIIVPLRITGIHKTLFNKDQISPPITIVPHKGTYRTAILPNITHQMHHDGCKIQLSQWTLAILEPSIAEEEDEETLEEEEANTTTSLLTDSKAMPQVRGTLPTCVSNVDK